MIKQFIKQFKTIDGKYTNTKIIKKRYKTEYNIIMQLTEFLPQDTKIRRRLYHIDHDLFHIPLCQTCGINQVTWHDLKYHRYCSNSCVGKSEAIIKEKSKTTRMNFGVDHPMHSGDIKTKIKSTCIEKYGADHHMKNVDILSKANNTCIARYGVDNPMKHPDIRQRATNAMIETCRLNNNVNNPSQLHISSETYNLLNDRDYMILQYVDNNLASIDIANKLNIGDGLVRKYLHIHNISMNNSRSSSEVSLYNFIASIYFGEIQTNSKTIIPPLELDIYIPEHKLAFEFNGLYWHSEDQKHKNYHLDKTNMCKIQDIRLIHIFEDDWNNKQNIIKSKIVQLLGLNKDKVFARKTTIVIPTKDQKSKFYNATHIQGTSSSSINIGLEYNNELVACMSFKQLSSKVYELVRYSTSVNVVGGFSKLLKYFQQNYEWKELISFADLSWSNGDLYEKTGWTLDKQLYPDYQYIVNNERKHKFGFRHKQLKNILENYDPNLSEHQNMLNHGIFRIYNCGLLRYVMINH